MRAGVIGVALLAAVVPCGPWMQGDRPLLWAGEFRAGASAVDISPRVLPAIANGGFLEASRDRVDDPLHARSLVLSDGATSLCIAIVDSCMVPRDVCDEIKRRVEREIGLPANRILIAATHTHSAPSLMDYCLGSRKDPAYADYFISQVVSGIVRRRSATCAGRGGLDRDRRARSHALPTLVAPA